ncbi:YceI family protein [Mycolicibacillus parakoreensis]|uniref:YceI family protein n=1 Tax=Mycolicibacillus parakoreensis TaxID=1069221 RepID=A0ABY3TY17_9MYCO|nr:YceI family protein [Mycolicibacillus parakoreensis]MCV7317191.1 YceI family protein [Mycolicibacillus parakoreensis]ULN51508.1 YceI family protein [Mycolicibacillus parakoreensis]
MATTTWTLHADDDPANALTLRTGVTGRAARMGHRLTLAVTSWRVTVDWDGEHPVAAALVVDVDSLAVRSGEGGLTPLSGPEKALVRTNALKTLNAKKFPTVEFHAEAITAGDGGYTLRGPLSVHGVSRSIEVALTVTDEGDHWRLGTRSEVSQAAHHIKPYSMAMGAMRVADAVGVEFAARRPKG